MTPPMPTNRCLACRDGVEKPFPFSIAFQPIVDVVAREVFAYEALVRGPQGEPACSVLNQITQENRYAFDQNCRVAAISTAVKLGLVETGARLSINFMPGAVYSPSACIQLTLETARRYDFPVDRLIFEITEGEEIVDKEHLRGIVEEYRRRGFKVSLDDFGAAYSGLTLLSEIPVDHLKLDIGLVRDLGQRPTALMIVQAIVALATALGQSVVAEGVETMEEYRAVRSCGIRLIQGYLLAKPGFEQLPEVHWPEEETSLAASGVA
ncbi:MAG: EAL domain-containing protein [Acidobacteria bacterium]|nr:EAL domain-containing protein [Acidobacteriota bacterium]